MRPAARTEYSCTQVSVHTTDANLGHRPFNYSSTNDVSAMIPLPVRPLVNWLQAGAGADITFNAPTEYSGLTVIGVGRNLSAGRFVTSKGIQGFSLSLGPSIWPTYEYRRPTGQCLRLEVLKCEVI